MEALDQGAEPEYCCRSKCCRDTSARCCVAGCAPQRGEVSCGGCRRRSRPSRSSLPPRQRNGRLCEGSVRRPGAGARVPVAVHASGGHQQQPNLSYETVRSLSAGVIRRQQSSQGMHGLGRRVPATLSAARAAGAVRADPLLRLFANGHRTENIQQARALIGRLEFCGSARESQTAASLSGMSCRGDEQGRPSHRAGGRAPITAGSPCRMTHPPLCTTCLLPRLLRSAVCERSARLLLSRANRCSGFVVSSSEILSSRGHKPISEVRLRPTLVRSRRGAVRWPAGRAGSSGAAPGLALLPRVGTARLKPRTLGRHEYQAVPKLRPTAVVASAVRLQVALLLPVHSLFAHARVHRVCQHVVVTTHVVECLLRCFYLCSVSGYL